MVTIEVLEAEVAHLTVQLSRLEKQQSDILKELGSISNELTKSRGMWGGIMLVTTAIGAVITIWFSFMKGGTQ